MLAMSEAHRSNIYQINADVRKNLIVRVLSKISLNLILKTFMNSLRLGALMLKLRLTTCTWVASEECKTKKIEVGLELLDDNIAIRSLDFLLGPLEIAREGTPWEGLPLPPGGRDPPPPEVNT
jgi:hypothetical protein